MLVSRETLRYWSPANRSPPVPLITESPTLGRLHPSFEVQQHFDPNASRCSPSGNTRPPMGRTRGPTADKIAGMFHVKRRETSSHGSRGAHVFPRRSTVLAQPHPAPPHEQRSRLRESSNVMPNAHLFPFLLPSREGCWHMTSSQWCSNQTTGVPHPKQRCFT